MPDATPETAAGSAAPPSPPSTPSHPGALERLFRISQRGSTVGQEVVVGEAEDGQVRLSVSDTGIGLAPDEASRLFQEFVRIKNERTRTIPGTGLGLSIVKKLAQLYGGDVEVQSEPNVGSTFTVTLRESPVKQA